MTEPNATRDRAGDEAFVRALEDGSLPADVFDHRQHLRYAWLLLQRIPLGEALPRIGATLERFAGLHGAPEKYHVTVTWTYVLILHELMQDHRERASVDFDELLERNPLLREPVPRFMARFYAPATWQSPRAASIYVLPDRVRSDMAA